MSAFLREVMSFSLFPPIFFDFRIIFGGIFVIDCQCTSLFHGMFHDFALLGPLTTCFHFSASFLRSPPCFALHPLHLHDGAFCRGAWLGLG